MTDDDDDFEDLLGIDLPPAKPARRPTGRPRMTDAEKELAAHLRKNKAESAPSTESEDVLRGVTVTWLGAVFKMSRAEAAKRLVGCPAVSKTVTGQTKYLVHEAAKYLVDVNFDVEHYLRNMKATSLPNALQKAFWEAKKTRLSYQLAAGELWHSDDVMDVLGESFKRIKTTMQLWVDNLDRVQEMTPEQRDTITKMVDGLSKSLHETLIDQARENSTPNALQRDIEKEGADDVDVQLP